MTAGQQADAILQALATLADFANGPADPATALATLADLVYC